MAPRRSTTQPSNFVAFIDGLGMRGELMMKEKSGKFIPEMNAFWVQGFEGC